jgi:hypothetical protein
MWRVLTIVGFNFIFQSKFMLCYILQLSHNSFYFFIILLNLFLFSVIIIFFF